jgi:hypothetical protein
VKRAVVAEGLQIELERLALDEPATRDIIDHQMREVGLTRDRTE